MRSRDLWLWLGAALLTVTLILSGIAFAVYTKEQHFSLYTSWQFIVTCVLIALAFACFLCAILGLPLRPHRQRFPSLTIVSGAHAIVGLLAIQRHPGFPPENVRPQCFLLTITNNETERTVSIRNVWLHAKTKPGSRLQMAEWLFSPEHNIPPMLGLGAALEIPIVLDPQESKGGAIVFLVPEHFLTDLTDPIEGEIRLVDGNSREYGYFMAGAGIFRKGDGLRRSRNIWMTENPWVAQTGVGEAAPDRPWPGLLGPPNPA